MFSSLQDNDLEALNVPSWTHVQKTPLTDGSIKRHSMSLDSMWDDTESSVTTSPTSIQYSESKETRRQSRDVLKMGHQIQADVLVKKELVVHLEKQKDQFSQMKTNYNEKLSELKTQLNIIEQLPKPNGLHGAQQIRAQYEVKLKRLASENMELKKKVTQTTQQLQQYRTRSESSMNKLKKDLEGLALDKKQLTRQLKQATDKSRTAESQHQRDVQHLKRRVHVALESKKKCQQANQEQAHLIQKRTEETAAATMQLRQLTNALRKAASEGSFLNEHTLEKILSRK